jgi:hypothetical protein
VGKRVCAQGVVSSVCVCVCVSLPLLLSLCACVCEARRTLGRVQRQPRRRGCARLHADDAFCMPPNATQCPSHAFATQRYVRSVLAHVCVYMRVCLSGCTCPVHTCTCVCVCVCVRAWGRLSRRGRRRQRRRMAVARGGTQSMQRQRPTCGYHTRAVAPAPPAAHTPTALRR